MTSDDIELLGVGHTRRAALLTSVKEQIAQARAELSKLKADDDEDPK